MTHRAKLAYGKFALAFKIVIVGDGCVCQVITVCSLLHATLKGVLVG